MDAPAGTSEELPPSIPEGWARLTFLGTGSSEGIPRISCLTRPDARSFCATCWSARHLPGSRNRRRNTGAVIQLPQGVGKRAWAVGLDCGKMWWESAVIAFPMVGLRRLDAVVLTHWHQDALLGLDDLRDFTSHIEDADDGYRGLTVFSNLKTLEHLKRIFPYMVHPSEELKAGGGGVPEVCFDRFVDGTSFEPVPGLVVTPFNVEHGRCREFSAFRIGSLAYISDISGFPEGSRRFLQGARQLVLDGLKPGGTHPSHFTIENVTAEIQGGFSIGLVPEHVWLVGMNHEADHDAVNAWLSEQGLPCPTACAYDTQQLDFHVYNHRSEIN